MNKQFHIEWSNSSTWDRIKKAIRFIFTGKIELRFTDYEMDIVINTYQKEKNIRKIL